MAENARRISDLGRQLYERLRTLTEHVEQVGDSPAKTVEAYTRAVGSLEKRCSWPHAGSGTWVRPRERRSPSSNRRTARRGPWWWTSRSAGRREAGRPRAARRVIGGRGSQRPSKAQSSMATDDRPREAVPSSAQGPACVRPGALTLVPPLARSGRTNPLIPATWWAREDLNLGPLPCQGSALTPELRARRTRILRNGPPTVKDANRAIYIVTEGPIVGPRKLSPKIAPRGAAP